MQGTTIEIVLCLSKLFLPSLINQADVNERFLRTYGKSEGLKP